MKEGDVVRIIGNGNKVHHGFEINDLVYIIPLEQSFLHRSDILNCQIVHPVRLLSQYVSIPDLELTDLTLEEVKASWEFTKKLNGNGS